MNDPEPLNPTERLDLERKSEQLGARVGQPDERYPYIGPDYKLPFLHVGTERQLFLDNFILDELTDVERRFPEPERPDDPVLEVGELPWEQADVVIPAAALRDPNDGRFRLWYNTSLESDPFGDRGMILCCAESSDGLHWEKQVGSDCLPCAGQQQTNVVLTDSGHHIGLVVNCDQSDPERRYLLVYNPHDEARAAGRRVASAVAASPDGRRWKRVSNDTPYRHHHKQAIIWDPSSERWIAYSQYSHHWNPLYRKRQIARQTSADFIEWSPKEVVLTADRDPNLPPNLEYHDMSVRKVGGTYIGIATEFVTEPLWNHRDGCNWRDTAVARLSLQCSRDGRQWHRVGDSSPWVDNRGDGNIDSGFACFTLAGQLVHEGKTHILYGAASDRQHWFDREAGSDIVPRAEFERRQAEWLAQSNRPRRVSVGALILREDGWAELRPRQQSGRVLTRQFVFEGSQLRVNADVSRGGSVRVEVIDPLLQPYEGFSDADCDPISGDSANTWHAVRWRGKSDVSGLWDRPVRLAFLLDNASLFSFEFVEDAGR